MASRKSAPNRFEGWPLDSLSINKKTGKYFVDGRDTESKENIIYGEYERAIIDFFTQALELNR